MDAQEAKQLLVKNTLTVDKILKDIQLSASEGRCVVRYVDVPVDFMTRVDLMNKGYCIEDTIGGFNEVITSIVFLK